MPRGKSKPKNGDGVESHLPPLVDRRLVKALDHVVRQHILLTAVQRPVSPNELARELDEGLSQVSYHVKVLHKDCEEMIELVHTEPRRGAVEHYYRATARTLLPAKAWRGVRKGLRAVVGAGQASDLFNDLADALKAGKLQGAHDHFSRSALVLDTEGQRNVKAIAERAAKEVEAEQRASASRVAETNGNAGEVKGYTFGLMAFEGAWEAADQLPKGASAGAASASGTGKRRSGGKRRAGTVGKPSR